MVNLQKIDDSSVKFVFTDSDHYLVGNGEIVVPINSLSLVIDESEMVTFKKSATGDPFLSFRADNSNLGTKEAIEQFYKENMVGAGGLSEEEVQDMIDSATSGIPSSQVVEALRNDLNTVSGDVDTKQDALEYYSEAEYPVGGGRGMINVYNGKTYISSVEADASTTDGGTYAKLYAQGEAGSNALKVSPSGVTINNAKVLTENDINPNDLWEKEEVIASALTEVRQDVADIDAKEEVIASALTEVRQNVDTLSGDVQTKADLSAVTAVSNDLNTLSGAVIDNEYTVSQSLNDLNSRKLDASAYTPTDLSQYWTSAQTQSAIDDAKAYYVDFAAMSVQGITDADWDGLVNAINAHRPILVKVGTANGYVNATTAGIFDNTIIVTGADEGNASKYTFTKNGSNDYSVSTSTKVFVSQTEKAAWNAKQDALSAGTGIEISGNVISAIGGDGSYVYYTEDTSSESATIKVQNDDGADNKTENRVFVGGGGIIFENYNETDDGEGNTGTTDTQVSISSLGLSISAYSDDGIDTTQTELEVQPMGAYINSEPIATESYVDAATSGKVDTSAITSSITSGSTDSEIPTAKAVYDATQSGGGGSITVDDALSTTSENPVQNKVINANILGNYSTSYTGSPQKTVLRAYNKNDHANNALSIGFSKINGTEIFKPYEFINTLTANFELATQSDFETHTGDTTIHVTSAEKTAWNANTTALGGLKLVKISQADYDVLATKDENTLYIIPDADGGGSDWPE